MHCPNLSFVESNFLIEWALRGLIVNVLDYLARLSCSIILLDCPV